MYMAKVEGEIPVYFHARSVHDAKDTFAEYLNNIGLVADLAVTITEVNYRLTDASPDGW